MLPNNALRPLQALNLLLAYETGITLICASAGTLKIAAQHLTYTAVGFTLAELTRLYMQQSDSENVEPWSCRFAGAALGWVYDNRNPIAQISQRGINHCTQWMRSYQTAENVQPNAHDPGAAIANRV